VAKTFFGMVSEAMAEVSAVSPQEARQRLQDDPNTLLIDVRDLEAIRETGMAEGAIPISNGALPLRADHEVPESIRDARLQDRSRPVITICGMGPMSTLGAKTLKDMGFENVAYVEGGTEGWKQAGLPTNQP
jgi:rhodanese-related sulfurtransferase